LTIQRLSAADFATLENPGFRSVQIVWPNNAPEAQVTITRVLMEPGAISARHVHPASEQIWLIEQGNALLLTADGQTDALRAGDVVRTPAGTIHGVANTGSERFVYLAVTTPPQDFSPAYKGRQTSN
jgi:quercetin dioxygenase-like cupin family protein